VTTGAANDIERATNIARSMVTRYGMSDRFGLMGLATVESQYLDSTSTLNCAENTAADIDEEVMKMLKSAYEEALAMLRDNKDIMDKIAAYLIEKETITGKEFMKIYREEKGLPEPEEEKKTEDLEEKKPESKDEEKTSRSEDLWNWDSRRPSDSDRENDKNQTNGESGETSRFGSAWDRNVNG
ncbi:MAG: hypothetical protein K2N89_09480, partial [Lachnospiraceae bacterium]|nr:hypothetical protein [Lachnospiraceae bacterium]